MRYLTIDHCLRSGSFPSIQDLIREIREKHGFTVSKPTIEKDLYDLRHDSSLGFFAPIVYSRRDKGYSYEDRNFSILSKPYDRKAGEAIRLSGLLLRQYFNSYWSKSYADTLNRIASDILNSDEEDLSIIQFDSPPHSREIEFLEPLYHAIREKRKVTISLDSGYLYREGPEMNLDPYMLKCFRGRWYLLGYSHGAEKIRAIAMDQIYDMKPSEDHFQRIPEFNPDDYLFYSYGITVNIPSDPTRVILHANPTMTQYLIQNPLHPSQQGYHYTSRGSRFEYQLWPDEFFIRQLIGLGNGVEVSEPDFLRKRLKQLFEQLGQPANKEKYWHVSEVDALFIIDR